MTATVEVILQERSKTHGEFEDNAVIAMTFRDYMRKSPNWNNLLSNQQLALDEIALKIARILSKGSANCNEEHWADIAGYAQLGRQACQKNS